MSKKSPYQRHGKTPWKYSELYQQWRAAVLRGDTESSDRAARAHYARFVRDVVQPPANRAGRPDWVPQPRQKVAA